MTDTQKLEYLTARLKSGARIITIKGYEDEIFFDRYNESIIMIKRANSFLPLNIDFINLDATAAANGIQWPGCNISTVKWGNTL